MAGSTNRSNWKRVDGDAPYGQGANMRRSYGGGKWATVPIEAIDWLGQTVHHWQIWTTLVGGRPDGSNYMMGTMVVKEGNAESLDEAMRRCDEAMGL